MNGKKKKTLVLIGTLFCTSMTMISCTVYGPARDNKREDANETSVTKEVSAEELEAIGLNEEANADEVK